MIMIKNKTMEFSTLRIKSMLLLFVLILSSCGPEKYEEKIVSFDVSGKNLSCPESESYFWVVESADGADSGLIGRQIFPRFSGDVVKDTIFDLLFSDDSRRKFTIEGNFAMKPDSGEGQCGVTYPFRISKILDMEEVSTITLMSPMIADSYKAFCTTHDWDSDGHTEEEAYEALRKHREAYEDLAEIHDAAVVPDL